MSWRGILTLVLLLAAAISGWSLWKQRPDQAAAPAGNTRSDYLLHEFELVALDAQGQESFTLRAPQLARDPNDRSMQLQTPLFLIPARAGSSAGAWEVRANTGQVNAEGDELRLRGAVEAKTADTATRPVQMSTEQLNIYPQQRRASSQAKVTIVQPGLILSGHGLEANLDDSQLLLKSDVKARYARTPR